MNQPSSRRRDLYESPRVTPRLSETDRRAAELVVERAGGATQDLFLLAANRLGFGPRPGQRNEWIALGGNESARFISYVDQQLHPAGITDSDYESRKSAAGFDTILAGLQTKTLHNLWNQYEWDQFGQTNSSTPQEETEVDWFLRAIYSRHQLQQVMTEFWTDHFNVYSRDRPTRCLWPHWVGELRKRAFGNFRDLLKVTSEHPAMLYYLDQFTSVFGATNENYLREGFELHTMGAMNYEGIGKQQNVPELHYSLVPGGTAMDPRGDLAGVFPNGIPRGYVDDDVFAAARAFNGYTFDGSDGSPTAGLFVFQEGSHDTEGAFSVLSFGTINIDQESPSYKRRAETILDMLAYHPGTARHIAYKLIRKFVRDDPPQSLVESAAQVFMAARSDSDQIGQVLRHIFLSSEFQSSFGLKMKRPFDVVVSALRSTSGHLDWRLDGDEMSNFWWRFERTGHRPFRWRTPDGYPDTREKWETASPRVMTWRLGQWLCSVRNEANNFYLPIDDRTPPSIARTPNALADHWLYRVLQRPVPPALREEVVDFLAQGFDPDIELDLSHSETEERLQTMMALIMAAPEFCER